MHCLRNKLGLVLSTGLYIMQVDYCKLYSLTLECQSGVVCCVRGCKDNVVENVLFAWIK